MNKQELINFYNQAETRANISKVGKSFQRDDRVQIVAAMMNLNLTPHKLGNLIAKQSPYPAHNWIHMQRLAVFQKQVTKSGIQLGYNGGTVKEVEEPFDGRIKTLKDVQPAFTRAARQLVRVGITTPQAALTYITKGFEEVKSEMKVERKVDRLVHELQNGELSRDEVIRALDLAKRKF
jgi:hypothetical protein